MKLLFFCLAISAMNAFGQCSICLPLTDATCTYPHDCISTNGCQSVTFTVPCYRDDYCIKVEANCSDCKYCQVCANVYQGGTRVPNSNTHRQNCGSLDCEDYNCGQGEGFELFPNITYTFYVCLTSCSPNGCEDCDCAGKATLYTPGQTSCP